MGATQSERAAFARETIREEYFQLAVGTRGLLQTHERILVAGATLLTGVAGVAVSKNAYGLLLALPLMIGVLSLFAMRSMVEILALGGYRKAIEDSIEAATGAPTVLWERSIVPTFNATIAVRAMHGLYAGGYLASLVGAAFVLGAIKATVLGCVGYAVGALVLSSVLFMSLVAVSEAADRAYHVANETMRGLRDMYCINPGASSASD